VVEQVAADSDEGDYPSEGTSSIDGILKAVSGLKPNQTSDLVERLEYENPYVQGYIAEREASANDKGYAAGIRHAYKLMSHLIRNPLISIGGFANRINIKFNRGEEGSEEDAKMIMEGAGRLEKSLRDFERCSIDYGQVDLAELLESAYDNHCRDCPDGGINLVIDNGDRHIVFAPEQDVRGVYETAFGFIKSNNGHGENTASIEEDKRYVLVFIESTGFTISDEQAGTVLKGAREVFDQHDGYINIESIPAGGTRMEFAWPKREYLPDYLLSVE